MPRFRAILSLAALPAAALWCGAAAAQDFTFTVPVSVERLPPEITRGNVCCEVSTASAGGTRIGNGCARPVSIRDGQMSGSFTVPVDVGVGLDPATARHYICALWFHGTVRGIATDFTPLNWRYSSAAPRFPMEIDNAVTSGPIPGR